MTEETIATFLVSFGRSSAFFFTAPVIGDRNVSVKVRLALAATVAGVVAPTRDPLSVELLPLAMPAELVLGAMAGFAGRLVLAGAEAGGQLIGLPFSLGFSGVFDPTIGENAVVTRRIALTLASLAFLSAGGLEAGVYVTAAAPADPFVLLAGADAIIASSAEVLVAGLRFAAPALIAGLLANLGVALASRAAPSLNIFSVMLAALLVVGGITLIATAPSFIRDIAATGQHAVDSIVNVGGVR